MTNYYFVGIKGTGMSSLALILHERGDHVSGSDISKETFTQIPLNKAGIQITDFNPKWIKKSYVLVKGNAFSDKSPQILQAKKYGNKILSYPEAVEKIIKKHYSIAIAGTHGKTSTTGLLSHIVSNKKPTSFLIGNGTGEGIPNSKYFIVEADEYRRHFMSFTPNIAAILNMDWDHPDYFKNVSQVETAFSEFANKVKNAIFIFGDNKNQLEKISPLKAHKFSFGFNKYNDFVITNVNKITTGSYFTIQKKKKALGRFFTKLEGNYGIIDTTAAVIIADYIGLNQEQIQEGIKNYNGTKRRFNIKYLNNFIIIDDYAHHPHEIEATISAARQKFPHKKLVAIFQPHTYSRVKTFKQGYISALKKADTSYLTPIFGSIREKNGHIRSQDILKELPNNGGLITKDDIIKKLGLERNSVLLFMGAGDIEKYEKVFLKTFKSL